MTRWRLILLHRKLRGGLVAAGYFLIRRPSVRRYTPTANVSPIQPWIRSAAFAAAPDSASRTILAVIPAQSPDGPKIASTSALLIPGRISLTLSSLIRSPGPDSQKAR